MIDDEYVKNRRSQLKKWLEKHPAPPKEKSYFSQLVNGQASFGARAARRIEKQYKMGEGYLERNDDAAAVPVSAISLEAEVINLLSQMAPVHEDAWFANIRAAVYEARLKMQEKRVHELTTRDPPHEVGHATSSSSPRRHARKSSSRG